MRVVHLVRQYPPGIGGIENFVSGLAERQAADGKSVRVVTLDSIFDEKGKSKLEHHEHVNGVEIIRVPFFGPKKYPISLSTVKHVLDFDIIHVHGLEFMADYMAVCSIYHRTPLVISTHGGIFHTKFARRAKLAWFKSISRASISRYEAVLASSISDGEIFATIAREKTKIIENAVDYDKFFMQCSPGAKTMIYFGRFAQNKGIERLIVWFSWLNKLDPEWKLILAGKEMGVQFSQLQTIASENGVSDAIVQVSQPTDAELKSLISQCSVYVCASHYEGFGLAAVEAIGAGLYPLLSNIPAFQRTVERVGFGTLINFSDLQSVINFIEDYAIFEQNRPGAEELEIKLSSFGWRSMVDDIETVYNQAIRSNHRKIYARKIVKKSD